MLLIFFSFSSPQCLRQCHKQKWCMLYFTCIKLEACVLAYACAITHLKLKILLKKFQFLPPGRLWHLRRKLQIFLYAVESTCLTFGHFLISNCYPKKILWGLPYLICRFLALLWKTLVGCWMQSFTNFLASPLYTWLAVPISWDSNFALHHLLKYWHEIVKFQEFDESVFAILTKDNFEKVGGGARLGLDL